jgi:hypothetical protein
VLALAVRIIDEAAMAEAANDPMALMDTERRRHGVRRLRPGSYYAASHADAALTHRSRGG